MTRKAICSIEVKSGVFRSFLHVEWRASKLRIDDDTIFSILLPSKVPIPLSMSSTCRQIIDTRYVSRLLIGNIPFLAEIPLINKLDDPAVTLLHRSVTILNRSLVHCIISCISRTLSFSILKKDKQTNIDNKNYHSICLLVYLIISFLKWYVKVALHETYTPFFKAKFVIKDNMETPTYYIFSEKWISEFYYGTIFLLETWSRCSFGAKNCNFGIMS